MSDEWHFGVRKCSKAPGYLAWCKRTPDIGTGPLDADGRLRPDVEFQFGDTADDALGKLKRRVLQ